ncbi:MAG: tetratricopeptide repeat protein [Candidatus Zixiibacteriota bacterium]|nr:MAG: tetratricopeptide repeat protein [candidate division Zixibacteria bacterium]
MKKDKLYLVIFLAIIFVSGAVIYRFQSSRPLPAGHPSISEEQSQFTVTLIKQISELKRQLEDDPDNYELLVRLGNNYYDLNSPGESIKYYEQALKLRPDSPEVIVDCGTMYREIGEVDRALKMFARAIELDPNLPQAYFNLGVVLLGEKNDPAGAAEIWQKFLDNNPGVNPELKNFFKEKISQAREKG